MTLTERIQKNADQCFAQFQKEQLEKTKPELFQNTWEIAFYMELHTYITENDLSEIFSKKELRKIAAFEDRLIASLYDHYISDEYASFITWGDVEEMIHSFLRK